MSPLKAKLALVDGRDGVCFKEDRMKQMSDAELIYARRRDLKMNLERRIA